MLWTEARVDDLKRLHAEGLSASQIAAELGGLTRNAVIGKRHRLGIPAVNKQTDPLTAHRIVVKRLRKTADKPREKKPAPEWADVTPIDDALIPIEQRRTLLELNDNTCRWPVGTPGDPDFFFCGALPDGDCPYCPAHRRKGTEPSQPRFNVSGALRAA